jgi:hypothetical protein
MEGQHEDDQDEKGIENTEKEDRLVAQFFKVTLNFSLKKKKMGFF